MIFLAFPVPKTGKRAEWDELVESTFSDIELRDFQMSFGNGRTGVLYVGKV